MQYFNQSNSEVEYIKDILRTNYVPTIRIFNSDFVVQPSSGTSTLYDGKSINLVSFGSGGKFYNDETVIYNQTIQVGKAIDSSSIFTNNSKYICTYKFGNWYKNISTNYIANKDYYDSNIHEMLGRYLRAYRDYYRIDVMNFYNCFSNRFFSTFSLPIPYNGFLQHNNIHSWTLPAYNSRYKITAFPILWDTEYTIKFCGGYVGEVILQAVYFNGSTPLCAAEYTNMMSELDEHTPITYTENTSSEFTIKIGSLVSSDDNSATELECENETKIRISKQNLLYLFMQFPSEYDAPIIVMEQPKFTSVVNGVLSTVSRDETQQIAFSDTLLEYLTGSAITYATSIGSTVKTIQDIVTSNTFYNRYGVGGQNYIGVDVPSTYKFPSGVFDDALHQIIYKAFFREYIRDNSGNIVKEIIVSDGSNVGDSDSSGIKMCGIDSIEYQRKVSNMISTGAITPVKDFIGFITKDVEARIMACK